MIRTFFFSFYFLSILNSNTKTKRHTSASWQAIGGHVEKKIIIPLIPSVHKNQEPIQHSNAHTNYRHLCSHVAYECVRVCAHECLRVDLCV